MISKKQEEKEINDIWACTNELKRLIFSKLVKIDRMYQDD